MNVIDVLTFMKVLETGKFPPMEEMQQKIEEQQAQQQAMQEQQMQVEAQAQTGKQGENAQPQQEMSQEQQQLLAFVQYLQENRPDILEAIKQLPEEEREAALIKQMQKAAQGQQNQQQTMPQAQPRAQPQPEQPAISPDAEMLSQAVINLLPQDMQAYLASLPPEQRYDEIQSILQVLAERGISQEALGGVMPQYE